MSLDLCFLCHRMVNLSTDVSRATRRARSTRRIGPLSLKSRDLCRTLIWSRPDTCSASSSVSVTAASRPERNARSRRARWTDGTSPSRRSSWPAAREPAIPAGHRQVAALGEIPCRTPMSIRRLAGALYRRVENHGQTPPMSQSALYKNRPTIYYDVEQALALCCGTGKIMLPTSPAASERLHEKPA
jgi:hypothetical protein